VHTYTNDTNSRANLLSFPTRIRAIIAIKNIDCKIFLYFYPKNIIDGLGKLLKKIGDNANSKNWP
jgi:hypothetical protein